ncbi:MAG: S8 family serine peptidase [Acidimicrobiales bacterium]
MPLWPAPPANANPEDYSANDHTPVQTPPEWPTNWANSGSNWMLASKRSSDKAVSSNPQELCGVEGNSDDLAWQTTTGRPATVIAVLDSGIEWCDPAIVDKIALNRAALPLPENAAGETKPQLEKTGQRFLDNDPYDLDDSGVFNVAQYANDPRVAAVDADYGGTFCSSSYNNGGGNDAYTGISAEDLIHTFGRARLPGGSANPYFQVSTAPAGFPNAIAGWDFLDNTNDPVDDVHYGHGTGEAEDIGGSADSINGEVGACPDCMILPVRVGGSFIATSNAFAQGVLFAVDSGATMVSEALGAVDETATAKQAIAYATAHGVPIVGSAADEESEHDNLPAGLGGIIDVNSTTAETGWNPPSYLYLNGCTNYGPEISVTVESASCSSEATGKASGTVGLLESAAADAVAAGTIKDYPGLKSTTGAPVPLSANEVQQLVTMSADDVDFATPAPNADPPAPADNYSVSSTSIPFGTATMYRTKAGFDEYTGWGRLDAARIVQWVKEGRIPPEASISSPGYFRTFTTSGDLTVTGRVAAVRSTSYKYQVDVGIGTEPSATSWRLAAQGTGTSPKSGVLATIPLASLAALFPGGAASLTGGATLANGTPDPDRFTFTIRVLVENAKGLVGVAQAADFLHRDPGLEAGMPMQLSSSLDAPMKLAPIGPSGEDVLLVPEAGGQIDALLPGGKELPGWPVYTNAAPFHASEGAFKSRAITDIPRGEIIGGVAVGDLASASGKSLDVVATDSLGRVYAWNSGGKLLPGWPVHTNPAFSETSARNPDNRLLPGFWSAPALASLQGNGQLDVVASSLDRHVYAWLPNGQPVPGWPVLVVDPAEVQSVDAVTNQVTFLPSADPDMGSELLDTPAVGVLTGHGPPDIVVGADEEYAGPPNANLGEAALLEPDLNTANSRVYAIYPNGSLHPAARGAPKPTGMPDPGAFLPGWPAHIADLEANLLPTIGDGVVASPALAPLVSGQLDVVTGAVAGPLYELSPTGTSLLGTGGGLPNVLRFVPPGQSFLGDLLDASMPALGGPSVAPIGTTSSLSIVDPAASIGRLLDEEAPGEQSPHQDQVVAWGTNGEMRPGFPALMNDLQFFEQPTIADVNGTKAGGYVLEASGMYDLRAYQLNGVEAPGFPKFTGGWVTGGAVVGPWGADADQIVATGTRNGGLLVWSTPTPACASPGPWAQSHHDLWNSNDLAKTGTPRPTCVTGASRTRAAARASR